MAEDVNQLKAAHDQLNEATAHLTANVSEEPSFEETHEVQTKVCEMFGIKVEDLAVEGIQMGQDCVEDLTQALADGMAPAKAMVAGFASAWEIGLLTGIIHQRNQNGGSHE